MRFPFPIPHGWFQVAWTSALAPGDVLPLRAFGKDFVLFRTVGGRAAMLDAYCPHLGAHLGHGGRVDGESIACPFHAFRFDTGGACVAVPYAKKVPPKAAIASHPVLEQDGLVFAWNGPPGAAPTFSLPRSAELASGAWTPLETYTFRVRTHNQEIGENSVDRAHFRYVHGTADVPDSELAVEGPVRRAVQRVRYTTPRGPVDGSIEVTAHGMGLTTTRFRGIAETLLFISHLPIDGESVLSRFSFTQPLGLAQTNVGRGVVREVVRQMEEDIPIWEHKRYLANPLLCDGDGPIAAYRRWAAQFYA